jgi:hypothetical protein
MAHISSQPKASAESYEALATYILQEDESRWRVLHLNPSLPNELASGYSLYTRNAAETLAIEMAKATGGEYRGPLYGDYGDSCL